AGPGLLDLWTSLTISQRFGIVGAVLVVVALIAEGWLLMQMMTQRGRLLLRIEALEKRLGMAAQRGPGLALGTSAPVFELPGLDGKTTTLQKLRSLGKPLILLFTDADCGPCTAMLPDIGQWQREHGKKMVVALVSRGTVEANRTKVKEAKVTNVFLQKDREVAQAYQALGTPSAVVVNHQDGTIGSAV